MKIANEIREYQNIINGNLLSSSGGHLDSIDPSTGKVWATIPCGTKEDAELAVETANEAFVDWSSLVPTDRATYLRKVGDYIVQHGEELAALETQDNGWVFRETQYGLIPSLASFWYDAAGATAIASKGETVQLGTTCTGYTLREPFGVVVGIIPWNAPLFTFTVKAAYALAAGNTVIIKPSELASVASLRYGELINEILPPGVLNVVSGLGNEVGETLVRHPKVKKVSLTGSGGTAKAIANSTAENPKPMILELGGKSPNIVFEDADLDKAAYGVSLNGIFSGNAGQFCVGGSRILIQRSIFDKIITKMKNLLNEQIQLGHTMNPTSTMGPIANAAQYEKVCAYIAIGKEEGGEIIYGGRHGGGTLLPEHPELVDGYWVEPTLIQVDNNSLRICQEEIFGPVATVIPFDTEEEAIAIANDTTYGLGAGIWTSNLNRTQRLIRQIESGNVWINTYRRVGPELPFGGVKESGFGTDSILEYTREKTCYIESE
ncbi:aldehyde dehydrogenase family protein [Viridibacillus arvi]|uniref:aldehyde dehydrogenase family protein n=1 Tax=Viridibacillus arvi TaxID=263475 RepID=UPI003D093F7F